MSFIISARCVRLKCPGVAKNVLLQLADIANDHGVAWPSIDTLCMRTDWSRTAVIEAITWLEANGALRGDRSNGRKTVYRLTPDNFKGDRHPDPKEENQYASRTGTPRAPVRQPDPTGTPGAPDRYAKRTLISKNHQEPSNTPPAPPPGERAPQDPADNPPGFERIWAAFPRKTDQPAALAQWLKLAPQPELVDRMVVAIGRWEGTDEWQRDKGRFIPRLAKWLRRQGWLDVPTGVSSAAPPTVVPLRAAALTPEQLQANGAKARALVAQVRAARGGQQQAGGGA